jgi:hypothetical protein
MYQNPVRIFYHLPQAIEYMLESVPDELGDGLWLVVDDGMYEIYDSQPDANVLLHVPPFELFGRRLLLREKRIINRAMRVLDDSHLWPINGRFNATERAIKRLRKWEHDVGEFDCAYSYWKSLETEVSKIVNGEI